MIPLPPPLAKVRIWWRVALVAQFASVVANGFAIGAHSHMWGLDVWRLNFFVALLNVGALGAAAGRLRGIALIHDEVNYKMKAIIGEYVVGFPIDWAKFKWHDSKPPDWDQPPQPGVIRREIDLGG